METRSEEAELNKMFIRINYGSSPLEESTTHIHKHIILIILGLSLPLIAKLRGIDDIVFQNSKVNWQRRRILRRLVTRQGNTILMFARFICHDYVNQVFIWHELIKHDKSVYCHQHLMERWI